MYFLCSVDFIVSRGCFWLNSLSLCGFFTLEGELTDQASCPRSAGSDPQTVISDTVLLSAAVTGKVAAHLSPHSPTSRYNPFNEDSDTNTSADVTPIHTARHHSTAAPGGEAEVHSCELEVIRYSIVTV